MKFWKNISHDPNIFRVPEKLTSFFEFAVNLMNVLIKTLNNSENEYKLESIIYGSSNIGTNFCFELNPIYKKGTIGAKSIRKKTFLW